MPDLGSLTSVYDRCACSAIHGWFRTGDRSYVRGFDKEGLMIFCRARELFYYLKGGRVDYGEEHSRACGHSQFGRVYEQG